MINNKSEISVAVTGVGAIIGQGIVHSLRALKRPIRIIGIDRNERSPGTYFVDSFEIKPHVLESSSDYLAFWKDLIAKHNIQIVMPGLDVDMFFLDQNRSLFDSLGVMLALNSPFLIAQTANKWDFGEWLSSHDFPTIPMCKPKTWEEGIALLGSPPLLLKPLRGNGSRGIVRLKNERDFAYWRENVDYEWMMQRIVGTDSEEYTVGVFGLGNGAVVGPFVFRRRLSSSGNTLEAEVVLDHQPIHSIVQRLCLALRPIGPTNLQFRMEGDVPYLLEINPRFSSSNSLRTVFGFNEAAMSLDFYVGNMIPELPEIKQGIAWRYAEDFVVYASNPV